MEALEWKVGETNIIEMWSNQIQFWSSYLGCIRCLSIVELFWNDHSIEIKFTEVLMYVMTVKHWQTLDAN